MQSIDQTVHPPPPGGGIRSTGCVCGLAEETRWLQHTSGSGESAACEFCLFEWRLQASQALLPHLSPAAQDGSSTKMENTPVSPSLALSHILSPHKLGQSLPLFCLRALGCTFTRSF